MTEELKQAARQALEALEHAEKDAADFQRLNTDQTSVAIKSLRQALTQRPAAQTEREAPYGYCPECGAPGVTRERRPDGDDKCSNGHRYPSRSAHASLPPQPEAQEMPDAVEHYGTVDDLPATQATPEPVQPFLVRDVAALLGASVPDVCKALVHLGHGQRSTNMEIKPEEALAVAEHIRAKAATPEPVGEPAFWVPTKQLQQRETTTRGYLWFSNPQNDSWTPVFTRPAPGVPDVDDLAQFIRQIDGKNSMGAGALAEHICEWLAAAQAKGADK